jgi:nitrogen regulatory protein PII
MKRIELIIEPAALDRFTDAAEALKLSDFDVTEVRCAHKSRGDGQQRLYRGHEFTLNLVERLKVDLNVADDTAARIAHSLVETVRPESIAILRLDRASDMDDESSIRAGGIAITPAFAAAH